MKEWSPPEQAKGPSSDTSTAGYHNTGALYDLSKPIRNAMRPAGEWNHLEITSGANRLEVVR